MGNIKSLPGIGETVTFLEILIKIIAAVIFASFDFEEAGKLAKGALNALVEYSEKNLIVGPVNSGLRYFGGDTEGAKRVIKSTGKAFESVVDNTPIVGHVKGLIHFALGDTEHGEKCMIGSTRSTAVLTTGFATGGLGGGVLAGGVAGVGCGVVYDGIHSFSDTVEQGERRTHGIWNIDQDVNACKDVNDVLDVELSNVGTIIGDFMTGSAAAEAGKSLKKVNKIKKQRQNLKEAIKKEVPNVDPNIAARDTIQAGRNLEQLINDGTVKGDAHVSTLIRDVENGETHQGFNSRARRDMNVKKFEMEGDKSGFKSKSQARKTAKTSKLMELNPHVEPPLDRNPASCAEQHAFDSFYKNSGWTSINKAVQVVSVKFANGVYETAMRCENCLAYAMGNVITDKVANVSVPVTQVTSIINKACNCGALAVGYAVSLQFKDEKNKRTELKNANSLS